MSLLTSYLNFNTCNFFRSLKWALSSDPPEEKDTSDASAAELSGCCDLNFTITRSLSDHLK